MCELSRDRKWQWQLVFSLLLQLAAPLQTVFQACGRVLGLQPRRFEMPFVISNFTDDELVEIWEAAMRAAGRDPGASKVVPRLGLVGTAKNYYKERICVHNTARETVLVSVVPVDVVTWAMKKIFEAGASDDEAEVAAAVKQAARTKTSLSTYVAMRDGESHHILLSSGNKAFVTIASVTDPKEEGR